MECKHSVQFHDRNLTDLTVDQKAAFENTVKFYGLNGEFGDAILEINAQSQTDTCGTCQGSRRFLQDNSGTSESIISVEFTVVNDEIATFPKAEEVTINMENQTENITPTLVEDTGFKKCFRSD